MKFIEIEIETVDTEMEKLLGDCERENCLCMVRADCIESFWYSRGELHINMRSGERHVALNCNYDQLKEIMKSCSQL